MSIKVVNRHVWKGNGIYIGRGKDPKLAPFGNPYTDKPLDRTLASFHVKNREEAIKKYQDWLVEQWEKDEYLRLCVSTLVRKYLKGEEIVLVCSCKPAPCHGDILAGFIEGLANLRIVTLDDVVMDDAGDPPF